jgi:glycosyltransferase involved in cell wall biosynthesis/GT2 family glycosyltransferase
MDVTVYVERIVEPYTGMTLLGVGGYLPADAADARVEVRYDGEPAAVLTPAAVPGEPRLHFSTQLPIEPDKTRLQVVVCRGGAETVVHDGELARVGDRPPPPPIEHGLAAKVRGLVRRGVRSVFSGEVLSPGRWAARIDRFAEFLLQGRQKVRYRLLRRRFRPRSVHEAFVAHTALTPARRAALVAEAGRFRYRPRVSILLPVWNSDPRWLRRAVESVFGQLYDDWELCISDDASTRTDHLPLLDRWAKDPRVKVARRTANGHISANSNSAADLATGEFVALLDHDDELAPHALLSIVRLLQSHPDADLVYSDEDKITEDGRRYDPQFKPDWSPDLLLSYNYVNHFTCVRRAVFERAGRFREGFEGSQDHDLLLRVTERTDRVHHVPDVLYHWRAVSESTAGSAGVKPYVHTAGRRAVEEALARRGVAASLYVPPFAQKLGLPVLALDGPDRGPTVAVIVRGPADAAARTVRAVRQTTAYRDQTVYLVIDGDADALNRMAAARTEGYLLFLDAGTEPGDPRWLSRLMAHATQPGVGAVGGLVRDADGRVVSAGTVLGMRDGIAPADAFAGLPAGEVSYYFLAEVTRTVAAVGGGCLLTKREAFDRAGGFDADRFRRTLFDVDLCTRLRGLGLRCVHVGGAELVRRSPPIAMGGRDDDPLELLAFRHAYGRPVDPFHNPNLSEHAPFRPAGDGPLAPVPAGPLRTLVAAHNLNNPEGAPRYLSEIVLGLADRGTIVPELLSPLGGAGAGVYADAGVPVAVADQAWGRRFVDGRWTPREYEAAQRYLRRELRRRRPDVVLANTLLTFPVVEAAARLGVPSVWVIHESYSPDVLGRLFPPFARGRAEAAFALAGRVVPASHDTAALFRHLDTRGTVRVLHNGLASEPFDRYARRVSRDAAAVKLPGPGGRVRIVSLGTVCERKGQHTLVEAAAELMREGLEFVVYLVGVRDVVPYAGYVRQLVRRHRLEGTVHLIPETDDPLAYLRAADVFVCTSHLETFSRAVLEAEAFGLPIVSTPCCGLSEQVFWGWNALPFPVGDAGGLADRLRTLIRDPGLRADMGRRSRAAFENHLDAGEMLDRYAAVIRAAAAGGGRQPPVRASGPRPETEQGADAPRSPGRRRAA